MAPGLDGDAAVSVCILDTTVLCNLIPVPGRDQQRDGVTAQMAAHLDRGLEMVLPLAAMIETGNHIAACGDGVVRRDTAARFVTLVTQAIEGETPFIPTRFFQSRELLGWLSVFPDSAMRGIGLADLSIAKEFHHQCALHPHGRVFIWSLDRHLSSYDRPASDPPAGR